MNSFLHASDLAFVARKSTVGWSIGNILLDITGGVRSQCYGVASITFWSSLMLSLRACVFTAFDPVVVWLTGKLSLMAGSLAFFQQFIDAKDQQDWGVFTKNVPKLLLSVESVAFDILFLIQHFVLYRHRYAALCAVYGLR
jgi:hypothetical protein